MADIFSSIKKTRNINYVSRDFESISNSFQEYLKQQFPNTFNDFSPNSSGLALLELIAYIGDTLNFYLDKQFNELFLDSAQEEKNIISLAKNLGYKPRGKSAAINNNIVLNFIYPATGSSSSNYEFVLKKGTRFMTQDGDITAEVLEDVDTSTVTTSTKNVDVTNNVVSASISGIKVVTGVSKEFKTTIGSQIPFLKIDLPDKNILEILSVTGSDGSIWYETEYLAQENVFVGLRNLDSSSALVPNILTLKRVPKRFVVERTQNSTTTLRFGSGLLTTTDSEFIPNPEDFILPPTLRGAVSGFNPVTIDTADFINTGTLGSSPSNIILTIKYRIGGGLSTNISSNTLTQSVLKLLDYKISGNSFQKSQMEGTMKVNNPLPFTGGDDEETLFELKENASAFFAAQNRVVTLQDYIVRVATMPPSFGTVFRSAASKDPNDKLGVKLSILSRNSDGTLTQATNSLKINVATYLLQFKSYSENINVTDAKIINLGVKFGIVSNGSINNQEILANCLSTLRNFFDIRRWNIGQSLSISQITNELHNVSGVIGVPFINLSNLAGLIGGRLYSQTQYNLDARIKNYILQVPSDSILEVKYPQWDLQGGILS